MLEQFEAAATPSAIQDWGAAALAVLFRARRKYEADRDKEKQLDSAIQLLIAKGH